MVKVKYLKHGEIEAAALCLLREYGSKFGEVVKPPVPVEEILEAHLGLTLEFDDLAERIGVPDVLGATWIQEKRVFVDQSLDPAVNPTREGRYRFTVAHEVAHWQLHRHYFLADAKQQSLFVDRPEPSIVCRRSSRKEPMEWQADMFAGYLLMPMDMIFEVWRTRHGNMAPYVAMEEMADLSARWGLAEDEQPTVDVAKSLARRFRVSGQAMQIRLIGLGLIRTEAPVNELFAE